MNRDVAAGLGLLALAGVYLAGTLQISQSSLSDEVGAGGLPLILGGILALLAAILAFRGWLARPERTLAAPTATGEPEDSGEGSASLGRALGFLGIAALYGPVATLLGYVGGLAFLIGAIALYERARPTWRLGAVALGGAVCFWLVFVQLLGVAQPRSSIF